MLYNGDFGYWELRAKVTFDGIARQIIVNPGVTSLDIRSDVYSRWVDWVVLRDNAKFLPAVRVTGMDPIPGGFTGDTYFTQNGWKLVYDPRVVAISGVLYSDDYATAYWDYDGDPIYPATVSALVNTAVSYQNVVTGTAASPAEIWAHAERALTQAPPTAAENAAATWGHAGAVQMINRVAELWGRLGLDPAKPLINGQSQISFGDVVMALAGNENQSTLTRQ